MTTGLGAEQIDRLMIAVRQSLTGNLAKMEQALINGDASTLAAAAQALDLDFIPLFQERYDLVFPQEYANSPLLAPLFDLLAAPHFRTAVSKLAGYDTTQTGNIVLND